MLPDGWLPPLHVRVRLSTADAGVGLGVGVAVGVAVAVGVGVVCGLAVTDAGPDELESAAPQAVSNAAAVIIIARIACPR
jgi:hypothetical protein